MAEPLSEETTASQIERTDKRTRPRGWGAGLSPNIRVQTVAALLGGTYRGAFVPVWQPFVLSLGASVRLLGLLESLGGWSGIVSSLMQLLGGWLADRVGRKPIVVLSSLFNALAMFLFTLAAGLRWWPLLVPAVILSGMGLIAQAARSSVTAESVNQEGRGRAYSLTMFAFIAPGVVSSVLGGWVAQHWGYLPIMAVGAGLEAIVLFTLARFLRETLPPETPQARPATRLPLAPLLRVVMDRSLGLLKTVKGLWKLLIPLAADAFFWGLAGSLMFGILRDHLKFTPQQLGWVNAFNSLAWALTQLPVGRLVERYGCKRFLVIAEALAACCIASWLLWPTFLGISLSYALLGSTAALWVPALMTLLAGTFGEKERGRAMGLVFTVQGLSRFPAPYLAGVLYQWKGYSAPLLAGLVGVSIVTVLLAVLLQDPPAVAANRPDADSPAPRT